MSSNFQPSATPSNLSVVNNELYLFDITRSKTLSVRRDHAKFAEARKIKSGMLRHEGVMHQLDGYTAKENSTITTLRGDSADGTPNKQFELRVNNVSQLSFQYIGLSFSDLTLDIDINTGDRIQIFVLSAGGQVDATNHTVEIAARQ